MTNIPTDEGWLYLASVLDLASRHLLGWSMGTHHDGGLICDALQAAMATRGRDHMDGTIFHTDRGAEGECKRPSQHLVRSCDGSKASGGASCRSSCDAFAGLSAGGTA